MVRETPDRIERAFSEVLTLACGARDSWLQRLAGDDPTIASEVRAYLAALDQQPEFLETPVEFDATMTPDTESGQPPRNLPSRIGQYRLLHVLGTGGMGEVYAAEQDHPRRTVALKLLRSERASENLLRRFEYEINLLARVRHPGIAQVLDAGTHQTETETVPYYAMEMIEQARDLVTYAREHELNQRTRLDLFLCVCDAVEAAHQHGVIHRDIKPANILVDGGGDVKLIDFGIARAAGPRSPHENMHTVAGQVLGTLRYMSPEQCGADSDDVDLRTDVYSLGVVLYELLCGQTPYDLHKVSFADVGRVIRQQAPIPPSQVNVQLAGDLETIILKSLAKEPDGRYRSVSDLADDLRRFLASEPIGARRPTAWHRLRLFARRRRGIVLAAVAAGAVVVLSVAGLTGMYLKTTAALREVTAARHAERAAEAELSDLRGRLGTTLAAGGPDSIREIVPATEESLRLARSSDEKSLLVGSALNTLRRLEAQLPTDDDALAALADTYQKVGDLHGGGWNDGADEVRQSVGAYERAVALRKELQARRPDQPARTEHLIVAQTRLADAFRKLRRTSDGLKVANDAVARAERLFAETGSVASGLRLIWALNTRSDLGISLLDSSRGIDDVLAAQHVGEQLEQRYPNEIDVLHSLAWTHFRLGIWRAHRLNDYAAGLHDEERSIAYHMACAEARPGAAWPLVGLLLSSGCEAEYLRYLDRADEAFARMQANLVLASKILDQNPDAVELLGGWWQNSKIIIKTLVERGEQDAALAIADEAIRRARMVSSEAPAQDRLRRGLADACRTGAQLTLAFDPQRALAYARDAYQLAGDDDYETMKLLVPALWEAGERTEARAHARNYLLRWPQQAATDLPAALQSAPPMPPPTPDQE